MISKARIKQIHSLEIRKFRREQGLFVAEGHKLVGELLSTMKPTYIGAIPSWIESHQEVLNYVECDTLSEEELSRASLLKTPQDVIALFPIPQHRISEKEISQKLSLALDGVQDPGNMGTICRIADWFGIEDIFCSLNTVDVYNPKAVQATMGALARVRVHQLSLPELFAKTDTPIYGTFLNGENIYEKELQMNGIIVMGNEGQGISKEVASLVNERLFIPNYPSSRKTTDSLNVAIATSILCAEFRRRS